MSGFFSGELMWTPSSSDRVSCASQIQSVLANRMRIESRLLREEEEKQRKVDELRNSSEKKQQRAEEFRRAQEEKRAEQV